MESALSIQQMVESYAEQSPNHIAIIDANSSYNYNILNQKANQLAHYLLDFKLKPDNLIAIAIEPSPQLIIVILAILKAGCGYLPLDVRHPTDRLQFILEDTHAPILITKLKSKEKFSSYVRKIIFIDEIWHELSSKPVFNPTRTTHPEDLAYTIYTSGSTGKPKGVLIEHKSVIHYTQWFADYSACQPQDRIDFSSSIIFDMAVTTTITALSLGLQIVICPEEVKKNVAQYLLYLKNNKINIIKLTPSYFKILIQEAKQTPTVLSDLRSLILGGEILLTKDCMVWLEIYPKHSLHNEYGPTETTVAVTQYKVTYENVSKLETIVPIGKPGINNECIILNDNNEPVISGEIGELHIGGNCLARGYLNHKELTAKEFITHHDDSNSHKRFYKTGDLCRYVQDEEIEFIKRIDDQVKIRGYRVEPAEIEACLTSYPLIKESAVIVQENPRGEAQLVAYWIPKQDEEVLSVHELRLFLQKKLADYMIPVSFIMMKKFPLTENGKLDKKAFPKLVFSNEIVMPQNKIEQQLINIWKKELHLQSIGINSNFFELGGHSLIAIRLVSEIEKKLRKNVTLEDIYKAPTITQLAKIIKTAGGNQHEMKPEKLSYNNLTNIPLSDFQFTFWISNLFEPKVKNLNIILRRRIAGKLDIKALNYAFNWLLKKHEILTYQVGKYFPLFYLRTNANYTVHQKDLTHCTESESEAALSNSLNELINTSIWQKKSPLIAVKLYLLKNDISELQISVSHMVFDDASEKIVLSDLSTAYLHFKHGNQLPAINKYAQYKDYIFYEKKHLNQDLETDIQFWQNYLHDSQLVALPKKEILSNMQNIPYSTYLDLSAEIIEHIHQICTSACVSLTDLLCAAITLSLKHSVKENNNNIFMNIIRSARDNDTFDSMIGCFLRLDPIKVQVNTNLNLIDLSKSIQQTRIDIEPYQDCSGMAKLACLDKNYHKKSIRNFTIILLAKIYCKIFPKLKLNSKMLKMYGHINSLRMKQNFLININILNNFISNEDDASLFGYKLEKIKSYEYDLSKIDNVLDICIFRNKSLGKNHLVISGNLNPSFRRALGEKIISILGYK